MQRESWQEMWASLKGFLCSGQCRWFLLWGHVKAILVFSILILQVPLMWDNCLCVPSATYSSPGIQRQWPCLYSVTWLVGQLMSEENTMWPSGTRLSIALWHCKALLFFWSMPLADLSAIFIDGNQLMVQSCPRQLSTQGKLSDHHL